MSSSSVGSYYLPECSLHARGCDPVTVEAAENPLGVRSGLWPLRFQLCCFFTLPYLTLP